ncbi:MAG: ceramidase domain-containing protein [Paracoccaceae bacterium]
MTEFIDIYCERTGPEFWSEPVNALTNAAFVLGTLWVWRSSAPWPVARLLAGILAAIGVGSFLFHTFAVGWAALADVLPILAYILVYVYAANRHYWGLPGWASAAGAAFFVPWAVVLTPVFEALPFFHVSAFYWPVPLLIAIYAGLLWRRHPATARGLAVGVAVLCASLTFRSVDMAVCAALPLGTHFLWHVLNGVMLAWMILVLVAHLERGRAAG